MKNLKDFKRNLDEWKKLATEIENMVKDEKVVVRISLLNELGTISVKIIEVYERKIQKKKLRNQANILEWNVLCLSWKERFQIRFLKYWTKRNLA